MVLPFEEFTNLTAELYGIIKDVEGYLTRREMEFLALLAAFPTTKGEILEIGSYKGKSTISLAKGAALTEKPDVTAVDPLTSPSSTDPDLEGKESCLDDFQNNLKKAGVDRYIYVYQKHSAELAKEWNEKIRLLWIDGDHTYPGTKMDFDMFSPFLSDGAIIAFHDTLNDFEGGIRVFMEDVLLSKNFGPAGVCGSIGWSQYFKDPDFGWKYRDQKIKLYLKLSKLIPHILLNDNLKGLKKTRYKIARWRVPHSEVKPEDWLKEVVIAE